MLEDASSVAARLETAYPGCRVSIPGRDPTMLEVDLGNDGSGNRRIIAISQRTVAGYHLRTTVVIKVLPDSPPLLLHLHERRSAECVLAGTTYKVTPSNLYYWSPGREGWVWMEVTYTPCLDEADYFVMNPRDLERRLPYRFRGSPEQAAQQRHLPPGMSWQVIHDFDCRRRRGKIAQRLGLGATADWPMIRARRIELNRIEAARQCGFDPAEAETATWPMINARRSPSQAKRRQARS